MTPCRGRPLDLDGSQERGRRVTVGCPSISVPFRQFTSDTAEGYVLSILESDTVPTKTDPVAPAPADPAAPAAFDPIEHAASMVDRRFRLDCYYEVGREKVR